MQRGMDGLDIKATVHMLFTLSFLNHLNESRGTGEAIWLERLIARRSTFLHYLYSEYRAGTG